MCHRLAWLAQLKYQEHSVLGITTVYIFTAAVSHCRVHMGWVLISKRAASALKLTTNPCVSRVLDTDSVHQCRYDDQSLILELQRCWESQQLPTFHAISASHKYTIWCISNRLLFHAATFPIVRGLPTASLETSAVKPCFSCTWLVLVVYIW